MFIVRECLPHFPSLTPRVAETHYFFMRATYVAYKLQKTYILCRRNISQLVYKHCYRDNEKSLSRARIELTPSGSWPPLYPLSYRAKLDWWWVYSIKVHEISSPWMTWSVSILLRNHPQSHIKIIHNLSYTAIETTRNRTLSRARIELTHSGFLKHCKQWRSGGRWGPYGLRHILRRIWCGGPC